jgi:flagellar hook-basal body complex protein FliE
MPIEPIAMHDLLAKLDAARAALAKPVAPQSATSIGAGAGPASTTKPVDFADLLKASIDKVSDAQNQASGLAERFQLGDQNVSLEDTMVALSKANISLQEMVQVRNRMIAAYHDIMNMQV